MDTRKSASDLMRPRIRDIADIDWHFCTPACHARRKVIARYMLPCPTGCCRLSFQLVDPLRGSPDIFFNEARNAGRVSPGTPRDRTARFRICQQQHSTATRPNNLPAIAHDPLETPRQESPWRQQATALASQRTPIGLRLAWTSTMTRVSECTWAAPNSDPMESLALLRRRSRPQVVDVVCLRLGRMMTVLARASSARDVGGGGGRRPKSQFFLRLWNRVPLQADSPAAQYTPSRFPSRASECTEDPQVSEIETPLPEDGLYTGWIGPSELILSWNWRPGRGPGFCVRSHSAWPSLLSPLLPPFPHPSSVFL